VVADELDPLRRLLDERPVHDVEHTRRVRSTVDQVADLDGGQVRRQSQVRGVGAEPDERGSQQAGVSADVSEDRDARHGGSLPQRSITVQ
jgi:hypothetical protein